MRMTLLALLCVVAHAGEAEKPRLVAIAPAEWVPALGPWVEARKKDFDVEAVALEDVLATNEGRDAPERIKRFLWRGWKERNLRYALLVGDADTFPFRFMVLDRCTPAAFDTAFYPSDLYYGDVARDDGTFDDWNGRTDAHHAAYFGEVQGEKVKEPPINLDGISYAPEIAVGRWPVSTPKELAAVVGKTLAWDPAKRERRALVLHQDGWVDAAARVGGWGDALAGAKWTVDRQIHGSTTPTPATVLAALKAGVLLALHSGHGEAWGWDRCLGPEEETALADAPTAIYASAGCGTAVVTVQPPYEAYLDVSGILHKGTSNGEVFSAPPAPPSPLQPGRLERTSIAERLVRAPAGGAVAYFGCTTGSQPCALTLLEGLALYAAKGDGPRRLGDAWAFSVARYWCEERLRDLAPAADWYPPSIFFQGMKFILLGDPSLPLP
jgi:hypothetical protein